MEKPTSGRPPGRGGGLLVSLAAVLVGGVGAALYAGCRLAGLQAGYGLGVASLGLAAAVIYRAQARPVSGLSVAALLLTGLSAAFANVVGFLHLAELAGITAARPALEALWAQVPIIRWAGAGTFGGLALLGAAVVRAAVLPRWGGWLVLAGALLHLPAQALSGRAELAANGLAVAGALGVGGGLLWIGRALWRGQRPAAEDAPPAALHRWWAGPAVMVTGLLLGLDAAVNMLGGLSLTSAVIHLLYYAGLAVASLGLLAVSAGPLGRAGGVLLQCGASLAVIPAAFIAAQLAGVLVDNRLLMAAWVDIPVGRAGVYLVILGWLLFGAGMVRAGAGPRWSGWLIVGGVALALPIEFGVQAYAFGVFWVVGAALAGAGVLRLGWSIFSRPRA